MLGHSAEQTGETLSEPWMISPSLIADWGLNDSLVPCPGIR